MSYGTDEIEQYRRAAVYVDRILKGEKPADLPVQAPTKYEMVHQPKDREGARPRRAAVAARPRRRGDRMRRREFIAGLGGAAAWPFAARAQQSERVRRIGVYGVIVSRRSGGAAAQRSVPARAAAARLDSRPQRSDRLSLGQASAMPPASTQRSWPSSRRTSSWPEAAKPRRRCCKRRARYRLCLCTRPIRWARVSSSSLARPGGNATGFTQFEYSMGGKWLELLKQIAPSATRVGGHPDPAITAGIGQFAAIQAVAPAIEHASRSRSTCATRPRSNAPSPQFARAPNGGLIVTGSALAVVHRELIIELAAEHKLPAVYHERSFVAGGGLMSYGPDLVDQYRRAAGYVDRILKGEKPADLPVQRRPSTSWSSISRPRRRSVSTVPPTLLARADEVIE